MDKKPYTPPRIISYVPDQVPDWIVECFQNDLEVSGPSKPRVAPIYTTIVDSDRRYVWVSDNFCELLGYNSDELIGKRYDEVTAPTTSDIPVTARMFKKLGYMHGLWMLIHRTGERILIRYEAWLRADSLVESNIEVVDHLR
jgi:PAS domain S-box-containing protein